MGTALPSLLLRLAAAAAAVASLGSGSTPLECQPAAVQPDWPTSNRQAQAALALGLLPLALTGAD